MGQLIGIRVLSLYPFTPLTPLTLYPFNPLILQSSLAARMLCSRFGFRFK